MDIVIQHIEVFWTKKSRGNDEASNRSSVPEVLHSEINPEFSGVILHKIVFNEGSGFSVPVTSKYSCINVHQQRQLGFKFEHSENKLLVSCYCENGVLRKIGTLKHNTWLQVIDNERVSLEYTWGYYKHVFNIFFGNYLNLNSALSSQSPVVALNNEKHLW